MTNGWTRVSFFLWTRHDKSNLCATYQLISWQSAWALAKFWSNTVHNSVGISPTTLFVSIRKTPEKKKERHTCWCTIKVRMKCNSKSFRRYENRSFMRLFPLDYKVVNLLMVESNPSSVGIVPDSWFPSLTHRVWFNPDARKKIIN